MFAMYRRLRPYFLKRFVNCYYSSKASASSRDGHLLVQCLPSRTVLRIIGENVSEYLQGMITNDMNHISAPYRSMYAMFLNSKGRVLYDSIIYREPQENSFLIECDFSVVNDLKSHLNMYKVRRKLIIESLENDINVWNVNLRSNLPSNLKNEKNDQFTANIEDLNGLTNFIAACDPRVIELGWRVVAPKECDLLKLIRQKYPDTIEEFYYRELRHRLGISEGIAELPPGNCFPLESNCDYLHGVSFHKGCYIGQELTARTYHTGVVRKRIMPLFFEEDATSVAFDSVITSEDKTLGKVRSVKGLTGIGLLRVEEVLKVETLMVSGKRVKTLRPHWWPVEATKERRSAA